MISRKQEKIRKISQLNNKITNKEIVWTLDLLVYSSPYDNLLTLLLGPLYRYTGPRLIFDVLWTMSGSLVMFRLQCKKPLKHNLYVSWFSEAIVYSVYSSLAKRSSTTVNVTTLQLIVYLSQRLDTMISYIL